jgi:hypothetical protein
MKNKKLYGVAGGKEETHKLQMFRCTHSEDFALWARV